MRFSWIAVSRIEVEIGDESLYVLRTWMPSLRASLTTMFTFSNPISSGCRDKTTDKSTLSPNGSSSCVVVVVVVVAYIRQHQQHLLEHKRSHQTYALITACKAGRVLLDATVTAKAKEEVVDVLVVHVEFPSRQSFVRRGGETAFDTRLQLQREDG